MDAVTKHSQTALHFATAAIAGPALIGVSLFYVENKPVRIFLGVTGVVLTLSHYAFLHSMLRSDAK